MRVCRVCVCVCVCVPVGHQICNLKGLYVPFQHVMVLIRVEMVRFVLKLYMVVTCNLRELKLLNAT